MVNRSAISIVTLGLLALTFPLGCGPSPLAPVPARLTGAPVDPPSSPPSVVAVSPDTGSTDGSTRIVITGTGFQVGTRVTLDSSAVTARSDPRDALGTVLYLETPPHDAGTVDVVVTNPDGRSDRLSAAYTYAPPGSFDFNGNWSGYGTAGQDIPIGFSIENGMLMNVSCDTYATLTFAPPLPVTDGAFSFSRDDGVKVTGRIVSASAAVGTLNLSPCSDTSWTAVKPQ